MGDRNRGARVSRRREGREGWFERGGDQADFRGRWVGRSLGTGMGEWPAPTASGTGPEGAEFKARLMVEIDMWQRMAGTQVGRPPAVSLRVMQRPQQAICSRRTGQKVDELVTGPEFPDPLTDRCRRRDRRAET